MHNIYNIQTMQLLKLCIIVYVSSACVAAEEVCIWEKFNASCAADEVVFIETAFFGRMNNSRCFNVTENETHCMVDLRKNIQKSYGFSQTVHFTLASELFTKNAPRCYSPNTLQPYLEITHRCTKSNTKEVCISETFEGECPSEYVIFIQSALFGRMRSSRCIEFEKTGIDCYGIVQLYFEQKCNGRRQCRVSTADEQLRHAGSSCNPLLKPYLEVHYTCAHGFACPPLTFPDGASVVRNSDGYQVSCPNETIARSMLCQGNSWTIDPEKICPVKDGNFLHIVIFIVPAAVLLVSIISVAILLHRMQKKAQSKKTREDEYYADYPESHLRRNGAAGCNSVYDEYGEIDDCEYGAYSEVRCTGP